MGIFDKDKDEKHLHDVIIRDNMIADLMLYLEENGLIDDYIENKYKELYGKTYKEFKTGEKDE